MCIEVQSRVLNADTAFQLAPLPPHLLPIPHVPLSRRTRLTFLRPTLIMLLSPLKSSSDITLHPEENQTLTVA